MLKTFTFDGKNISDFHVKVGDSGIYEAPVRSVQHSYIPRKNGSFITDNRYFEDVIIFYQAVMTEGFGESYDDLRAFLSDHANTYFRLEDEFRPNHFRMAKFEKISGLRFTKHKARFDIYFRCKPQLFLKSGEQSVTVDELVTSTIKGSIVHVDLADDESIVDVLIDLNPQQEGGGTPSTTNIRPIKKINGWKLIKTGKNLLPFEYRSGEAGGLTFTATNGRYKVIGAVTDVNEHLKIAHNVKLPVGTYNLTGIPNNVYVKFDADVYEYQDDGILGVTEMFNIRSFTVTKNTDHVDIFLGGRQKYKNVSATISPMLVVGEAGEFERWKYNEYSINGGNPTIYGGKISLATGDITSDWIYLNGYAAQYSIGDPWVSDRNEYAEGTKPTYNAEIVYKTDQAVVLPSYQPFAYKFDDCYLYSPNGDVSVVIGRGYDEIVNPTLFESKPLIRINGNGVVYVNDVAITVSNSPYSYIDIDCELMKCTSGNNDADSYVSFSGNDFPVLKRGTNRISVSTGTQAVITPRWYTL